MRTITNILTLVVLSSMTAISYAEGSPCTCGSGSGLNSCLSGPEHCYPTPSQYLGKNCTHAMAPAGTIGICR